ncbi:MAG: endonuclease/exonuclease/phosphatase family protein [Pirellulales bacterium]|nr:endonuclease/exonuclease/phosphatase family protein [Pirellulales bacterium]
MSKTMLRLTLVVTITTVFCGWAAGPLPADEKPETKAHDAVKIMSFNIRMSLANDGPDSWSKRRELVADTIRRYAPDFLGTQEAMADQVAFLRKKLPQYGSLAVFREKIPLLGEACALFYRRDRWQLDPQQQGTFWLSETPEVRGSKSWKTACTRIVTWGRFIEKVDGGGEKSKPRVVYVYNTHFDHKSKLAREKSAEMIARRIAERQHKDPVVLMGDLNAGESSRPIEYLTGRIAGSPLKLVDTFRALHPEAENMGTFCAFKGETSGAKIDYIFVLPETKVLAAEIVRDNRDGRYPSDHFPVTASVNFER